MNANNDHVKGLSVEELAEGAGIPVSTVRMYQHRGLIPPPARHGRAAVYGRAHAERLHAIAQLQERGFSLAGIKELFDGMAEGETLRSVVGLGGGASLWDAEPAETLTLAELAGRLPTVELSPAVVRRVVELGLVELAADGRVVVRNPTFLRIGGELAALGVPTADILDEYERLRAETDEIARRFTDLFRRRLWKPFVAKGMAADDVAPLLGTLERLAALADDVTRASLHQSLHEKAEAFARAEARRLGVDIRPGGAAS